VLRRDCLFLGNEFRYGPKVAIRQNPLSGSIDIFIYSIGQEGMRALRAKQWEMVSVKEEDVMPEPTLRLERWYLELLAQELDRFGVKTEQDAKLEGTIEAMREHLQDLRKMLKLV
jgi:hypothetical protein